MKLTVHSAQISTATVEIKTLTISGKQVTLSVYRQLKKKDIFDSYYKLIGTPWGIVNYNPDKCDDMRIEEDKHLHVVWQYGDELRRCCVEYYDVVTHRTKETTHNYYSNWSLLRALPQLFISV
jgi:hypothetical protein